MKIKIISDGTPHGTKVIDMDTGEPIAGILEVTWRVDAGGDAIAELKIYGVPVEVVGKRKDIEE